MDHLEISKPFASYVCLEEMENAGETRQFLLRLRFQLEGTGEPREMAWPWTYSTTPRPVDALKADSEDLTKRCQTEVDMFRRHVEYELAAQAARAYSVNGSEILVWSQCTAPRPRASHDLSAKSS